MPNSSLAVPVALAVSTFARSAGGSDRRGQRWVRASRCLLLRGL